MRSKAFYSFYVFVLLSFMVMAIIGYFSVMGQSKSENAENHLLIQKEILSKNLAKLLLVCLQKYSLQQCQNLEFDLKGYQAKSWIGNCEMEICVVDLLIERISPLNSQLIRHHKREVWNLKNLKHAHTH